MKTVQGVWEEFAAHEPDCLARCADELLAYCNTGRLAECGLVRVFAHKLKEAEFAPQSVLRLAEDHIKELALIEVSTEKVGVRHETSQP